MSNNSDGTRAFASGITPSIANADHVSSLQHTCIHHIVELHASHHPDRIALVSEDQICTYQELNQRANQLAHRLRRQGAGPEVLIGIAIDRSIDMVVGLLGILKSGGAYLPLSLKQPRDRLLFMLNDARATIVVTHEKVASALACTAISSICLDQDAQQIELENKETPESDVQLAHLAYIIYTSGSTGNPKGTEITHANLKNLIDWHIHTYNVTSLDRTTQLAEPGFDAAVWEIWSALTAGCCLYIPDENTRLTPSLLRDWLLLHKITLSFAPTPLAEQLLMQSWPTQAPLRFLLTGGDTLHTYPRTKLPFALINHYGPTECSVVTTATPIPSQIEEHSLPPIGQPITNTQTYILDQHLRPVPPGEVGEIYIGGAGVGRGYLQRPDLTAEHFVPNPWSNIPGTRLYKTGDLARYLPDGNLAFHGRADQQIKLRGLRIELGEIEAVLSQHAAVHSCMVTLCADPLGSARILAYLVPELDRETETQKKDDESTLITQWKELYDATYHQAPELPDQMFQFVGWHSSYTGLPLPIGEMQENIQTIVDTIAGFQPKRVLEIGCGTGLLLFRLAPLCDYYLGTDFSPTALHLVQQQLADFPLPQVELALRLADNLHDLPAGSFDTIILNSIIQYFPDLNYLLRVLEQAARLVAPGGRIFLGDLRNLTLLAHFHTSVQLYRAPATLSLEQVQQRALQQMTQEKELLLDPGFFHQLAEQLPGIEHVDIWLKRGRARNELTLFRYDVVLHMAQAQQQHAQITAPELDWYIDDLSLAKVSQLLDESKAEPYRIRNIPNARLWAEHQTMQALRQPSPNATVGNLRTMLQTTPPSEWIDPEAFWLLAESLHYHIEVSIAASGRTETFDVLLYPQTLETAQITRTPTTSATTQVWSTYANSPRQGNFLRQIAPRLRDFLLEHLPEYMVPSAFIVMDQLPLNANGKMDRRALPAPDWSNLIQEEILTTPQTPLEIHLADIWSDVLQLKRIGRESNFFEVGGHSLLAMRMITRIRDELQVELPITTLFQFPTLTGLADQIELARHKNTLLADRHMQRVDENTPPLSFAQQRLWFFHQLMPGNPFYNVSTRALLQGHLQPDVLEWSINEIVHRHESLRSIFPYQRRQPLQVIQPELWIPLHQIDLRSVPDEQREVTLQAHQTEDARRPFDLTQGPLIRATLFLHTNDHYLLLITMHHIICDGWSLSVFARELTLFYNSRVEKRKLTMPELPVRYRDYACWQHNQLQGAQLENLQHYWKAKLGEHPPELELPGDFPRPTTPDYHGSTYTRLLPRPLVDALTRLGQRETCTLPMVMLAAFKILLFRYTGQNDVIVGTPVAGRHLSEIEPLIGFFINTLVLRTDLGGNPTIQEVLARVRETMLGAYTHQEYPFEKLVEDLRPERSLSRNPLFQVMFAFQNMPIPTLALQGLAPSHLTVEKIDTQTANFDITLALTEVPEGMSVLCEYNTALFRSTTIEHLLQHYTVVLGELVEAPSKRLSEIHMLTTQEQQLLYKWATTGNSLNTPRLIHELIEQQAERAPDAPALEYRAQFISYGDLNARSNQLARYLQARGVKEETVIGICLEPSPEMIIGLLGILKAGAAYLPLDPNLPSERLHFMVQDSGAEWLLTSTTFLPHVQHLSLNIPTLCMEDIEPEIMGTCNNLLPRVNTPQKLAYLIYTSGSTGRPKGVMVSHEALVRRVQSMIKLFQLVPGDRQFQFISLVFDAAGEEIYPTLCAGATLLLSPHSPQHAGLDLWHDITGLKPTKMDLPCAYWQLITDEIARGTLTIPNSLQRLAVGGESPALEKLKIWNANLPHPVRFFNIYGPTEATIAVSHYEALSDRDSEEPRALTHIPIGRPLDDTTLYVLDTDLQLRPPGLPGELYIGGEGLARGYVQHSYLTAATFLPDPFSRTPGARLYRTGDLVRYLPNGNLEFLGRVDHQVKLRGFRIEAGEIENVLLEHPAIKQCAVLLREDQPGRPQLVAYIVASSDRQPASNELRQFLRTHLPDYMLPTAWIMLPELPRNALYKLDRRALPAPSNSDIGTHSPYQAPTTPEEIRMIHIWSEVLQQEKIGVNDNFFELGGHSLLATQIISRLHEEGLTELMLHDLFNTPTPAALAAKLAQQHTNKQHKSSNSTIQPASRERFRRSATQLQDNLRG